MTVTARPALGASTLNRDWYVDVNTGSAGTPVWTPVGGIASLKPGRSPVMKEDSDFDSGGDGSTTKSAQTWSLEMKLWRKVKVTSATEYDTGQEALRAKDDLVGPANSIGVRWYEMTDDGPREEAYQGLAAVGWSPDGGNWDDLTSVTVTLSGQGKRTVITHPDA